MHDKRAIDDRPYIDKLEFEERFVTELTKGCPNTSSQVGNELSAATRRLDKLEFVGFWYCYQFILNIGKLQGNLQIVCKYPGKKA